MEGSITGFRHNKNQRVQGSTLARTNATVVVIGPGWNRDHMVLGCAGMRAYVPLRPTTPHRAAGMRTEPPAIHVVAQVVCAHEKTLPVCLLTPIRE